MGKLGGFARQLPCRRLKPLVPATAAWQQAAKSLVALWQHSGATSCPSFGALEAPQAGHIWPCSKRSCPPCSGPLLVAWVAPTSPVRQLSGNVIVEPVSVKKEHFHTFSGCEPILYCASKQQVELAFPFFNIFLGGIVQIIQISASLIFYNL